MENPPSKYFRLRPGGEVRLKYAYIIKCNDVIKDASGKVVELRCTADMESKSGGANANRKIKGTIHWVHPMDCTFDFSIGVCTATLAFHIRGTSQLNDFAACILDHVVALDDVGVFEPHFSARPQPEIF